MNTKNNVFIIIDENEEMFFNGGYIPSIENLIKIRLFIDKKLELSQEDIDKNNNNVNNYWMKKEESYVKNKENKNIFGGDGYIYIYKQNDNYKIGKSKRIDCRNKKYITENPDLIELYFKVRVKNYSEAELKLHSIFKDYRINENREWFKLNDDCLSFIRNIENTEWGREYITKN